MYDDNRTEDKKRGVGMEQEWGELYGREIVGIVPSGFCWKLGPCVHRIRVIIHRIVLRTFFVRS